MHPSTCTPNPNCYALLATPYALRVTRYSCATKPNPAGIDGGPQSGRIRGRSDRVWREPGDLWLSVVITPQFIMWRPQIDITGHSTMHMSAILQILLLTRSISQPASRSSWSANSCCRGYCSRPICATSRIRGVTSDQRRRVGRSLFQAHHETASSMVASSSAAVSIGALLRSTRAWMSAPWSVDTQSTARGPVRAGEKPSLASFRFRTSMRTA